MNRRPASAGSYIARPLRALLTRGALALVAALTLTSVAHAAPTISLTAPGDGWAYNAPVTLSLKASAAVDPADTGATLVRVEFYADGQLIGSDATSAYSLAWNGAAVGSHVLTAKAVDSLGQETLSAPRTLIITDSTTNLAPTASLTAPANNAKYALPADITLTASAADIEKNGSITQVEFLANGQVVGSATTRPFSFVWSNPAAGTYTLAAHATDNLGAQITSVARSLIIEATNLPPTVSLGGVTAGTYLMPVSFSLTASASGPEANTPVAQVEFLANDQVIATQTAKPYALTWTPTVPGTYVLAARASDSQGLSATSATRTVTVNATNTAPTVSLTAPANNSIYVLPADLVVSANATDLEKNGGVTQVEFLANGQVIGTSSTKPYSLVWSNPPAGSYSLTARATDTNGAQTVSAARSVTISDVNAPPKVSLSVPANHAVFVAPASITLTASATGPEANTPIAQVEFLADGQVLATVTAKPYTYLWQNASLGSHSLTVRATDSLGAVTTSAVRTITVNANQAPVVSLTSPTANQILPASATITVTASATDIDGTVVKVDFYNGPTLIGTSTTAPYSITWSSVLSGSYSLTAVATDNLGGIATSAAVPVTVNALPTVSLVAGGAPYVASANATLTATAADSDGTIAKVEFFNGTTLVGTAISAPYTFTLTGLAVGSYSLTAKATDNLGGTSTSAAVAVTVAANQLPTVSLTSPTANQIVAAPATITVSANASDADGTIAKVEFYNGATLIGTATTAPYSITWNNVPSGLYSLTAVATDDKGGITTSAAVPITVNALPSVALTSPGANQAVNAPGSFTLAASATDSDGTIAKVEFYQGATLLGTATAAPYTVTWSNVPAGNYSLTAKATDNLGVQTTSTPINVSVIANSPPAISLTSPMPNQSFRAPATIALAATASDPDNNLAKVEFFQNGTLIATVLSPPYAATWSNVPQGSYQITAVATDAVGAQTASAPTPVTVTPAQASLYFIQADHLGTPRLVTDETNAVVWRNLPTTEPFGNTPPEDDPNATGQRFEMPLAFAGQYRDRESNLSYNFFRDYDPGTGRYAQSDPIGLNGGINTYGYAGANPVSYTDSDGLIFPAAGLLLRLIGMGLTALGVAESPELGLGGGLSMTAKAGAKAVQAVQQCAAKGSSTALSTFRQTTNGETFLHYGYSEHAAGFAGGLRPGGYATTAIGLNGSEAKAALSLPHAVPPNAVYTVSPAPGTLVNVNPVAAPKFGQPGGLPEFQFPLGTGPGTVSGPRSLP